MRQLPLSQHQGPGGSCVLPACRRGSAWSTACPEMMVPWRANKLPAGHLSTQPALLTLLLLGAFPNFIPLPPCHSHERAAIFPCDPPAWPQATGPHQASQSLPSGFCTLEMRKRSSESMLLLSVPGGFYSAVPRTILHWFT